MLDWFHLTMRLTSMTQRAKGLPVKMGEEESVLLRDEVLRQLERTKWFLWHGNVFPALKVLTTILFDLEMASFERDEGKISTCKACRISRFILDSRVYTSSMSGVTALAANTCGCDGGRIGPTHCASLTLHAATDGGHTKRQERL